jgi:hypothetical protein
LIHNRNEQGKTMTKLKRIEFNHYFPNWVLINPAEAFESLFAGGESDQDKSSSRPGCGVPGTGRDASISEPGQTGR